MPLTRIVTAVVLIPLVAASILYLPNTALALLFGLIVCLAAWEWAAVAGMWGRFGRSLYLASTLMIMLASYACVRRSLCMMAVLAMALLWWFAAGLLVYRYQKSGRSTAAVNKFAWLFGWLTLVPAWLSILWVHSSQGAGPQLVLVLMIVIWSADSAAYFGGRRWGRRRLANRVSPGKTWEGAAAALLASICVATLLSAFIPAKGFPERLHLVLISALAVIFSVVGDLTESLVKRLAGVKDSGKLLPGHGGVLDRIDSLTAAAPVFCLGLSWWGLES